MKPSSYLRAHWKSILGMTGIIVLAGLVGWALYLRSTGYGWSEWTGFGEYTGPLTKDQRGKTLWDWMELLIIPAVFSIGALLFTRSDKANEIAIAEQRSAIDQEIALDRQREQTLQNYIDAVTALLLEHDLRSSKPGDESRVVARTRTLATLRSLDPDRKAMLLLFLSEAGLISVNNPVCDLNTADLDGAELARSNLSQSCLEGASLVKANLMHADLSSVNLHGAVLREAYLHKTLMTDANLSWADLRDTNLKESNLIGSDLSGANLKGADFSGANLVGVTLENALFDELTRMPDGKPYDPAVHIYRAR
jgi:uncharacterized protein YjbI with pentapeptide repeats